MTTPSVRGGESAPSLWVDVVARRMAALACLGSCYQAAVTGMAPVWVLLSVVSAAAVARPVYWLPEGRVSASIDWPSVRNWLLWIPGWGLLAVAISWRLLGYSPRYLLWTWLAGVVWVLLVAARGAGRTETTAPGHAPARGRRWLVALCFVLIASFATGLRLWAIDTVPRDVHGDEGVVVILGQEFFADPDRDWLGVRELGSYSMMNLCYALAGVGVAVDGLNLTAARLPDVILGILSVVLTFAGLRRTTTLPLSVVASMLLAANHCHVGFSRISSSYIQSAFVVSLVFWLLARLWQAPSFLGAVWLALAVALGAQTYQASLLILPLFWGTLAILLLFNRARWKELAPALVVCAVTFTAASVPLAVTLWQKQDLMFGRARELNIFSEFQMKNLMQHEYHTDSTLEVVWMQAWNSLRGFYLPINAQPQYGSDVYGMADPYTAALMVPGAVLAILSLRRFAALTGLLFTVGYLLFGLGMQWAPGFNRTTGALPLGMALSAIAVVQCTSTLWRGRGVWKLARALSLAGIVGLSVGVNVWIYFVHHKHALVWGDPVSEAGWIAKKYAGEYTVHLVTWPLPGHEGQRLILGGIPEADRARVRLMPWDVPLAGYLETLELTGRDLFVTDANDTAGEAALAARFPEGRRETWQPEPTQGPTLHLLFVP